MKQLLYFYCSGSIYLTLVYFYCHLSHVPVPVPVLDLVICSVVHETNNVMLNKNSKIISTASGALVVGGVRDIV